MGQSDTREAWAAPPELPAGTGAEHPGFAVSSYPNPVKRGSALTVNYTFDKATAVTISVSDVSGKVVYTVDAGSRSGAPAQVISTEQWAAGSYLVTVSADGRSETKRLVVAD